MGFSVMKTQVPRHKTQDTRPKTLDSRLSCDLRLVSCVLCLLCSVPCALYSAEPDVGSPEAKAAGEESSAWEKPGSLKWLGLPVVSVECKCDGKFPEDRVRDPSVTVIRAGDAYSRSKIRKSIENIYSLGEFSNVEVDARPAGNGVALSFILTRQIKTRSVYLEGNKELRRDEIFNVMRLGKGQEYDGSIAEADVESIKRLYESRGYFKADISFSPSYVGEETREVDVAFHISEGGQSIIKEIVLIGTNQAVMRTKMLFSISLESQSDLDSRTISEQLLQKFENEGNSLSDRAAISIGEPGARWLITDVRRVYSIRKEKDRLNVYRTKSLLERMNEIKLGEVYKGQQALNRDVELIEKVHRDEGYITSKIKTAQALSAPDIIEEYRGKGTHFAVRNVLTPGTETDEVVIVIEIEQGKKVYIKIEGNKEIKDDDIRRTPIAVQRMHSVNDSVLRMSKEDIENLYKLKGYYLAKAKHEVLEDEVWDFDTDEDSEGWDTLSEFASLDVSDGVLRVFSSANTPQIQSPEVYIYADVYQKVQIRVRADKEAVGRLYWITNKAGKWNGKRYADFSLISDGRFHDYTIDMSKYKKTWSNVVTQLRLGFRTDLVPTSTDKGRSEQEEEGKESKITGMGASGSEKPRVDIEWIKVTTESIPIVFRVIEGKPMRIKRKISIVGSPTARKEDQRDSEEISRNELEMTPKAVRKQMLTRKKSLLSFWPLRRYFPDGIFDEMIFDRDLRAIIAFYKDEGYPNAGIAGTKIETNEEEGEIDITIMILEGSKTIVTEIILEGNREDILDNEEILSNLPSFQEQNVVIENLGPSRTRYKITSSKVFRESDIIADRSYLRTRYADEGYFAKIEALKQFNVGSPTARKENQKNSDVGSPTVRKENQKGDEKTEVVITYRIAEGKLITLDDEIEINGNIRTKRRVIERELSKRLTEEGKFSYSEIAKSWQNIYDLGLFEGVKIDTKPVGGSEDLYKMSVDVTERKAISVNTNIGFSSSEDFRGGIELTHINLWGTGRRARAEAQIGIEGPRGELSYTEPRFLGTRALGLVDLYRYSERDYAETRTGGTAGISQRFYRINTLTYRYVYDVVEYEDIDGNERVARIGKIGTTFQRDGRDNPLNPKKGWFHGLTLEYADSRLGGTETFTKLTMNNMYYSQLSQDMVLALGVRTGYAWGVGGTRSILAPEQFKLSDYTTPRGYKWKAGDVGNVMLNASMEIRFPIYKWVGAAVFFDSGYVYDRPHHFDVRSMKSAIGLGLRAITPVGPVRLDYGYPVRGNGDRNYWPYVAFGHAF